MVDGHDEEDNESTDPFTTPYTFYTHNTTTTKRQEAMFRREYLLPRRNREGACVADDTT